MLFTRATLTVLYVLVSKEDSFAVFREKVEAVRNSSAATPLYTVPHRAIRQRSVRGPR